MIEQDLARIAGALEQIAYVMAGGRHIMMGGEGTPPSDLAEESRRPEPTDIDAETHRGSSAAEGEEAAKREQIKADLRLLGVAFKESARTATLMKMLDDKLASVAPKGDGGQDTAAPTGDGGQDTAAPTGDGGQDTPPEASGTPENKASETEDPAAVTVTRDDVRMALIELSAAKGKDTALAMLRKAGGAEKLSDVPEDHYAAIVKACKERCNG